MLMIFFFFFSSRRRHTRYWRDWSSDVCSSDLQYDHPDPGNPDGLKCDVEGRVYCTAPGGIWVHNPDGSVVARLATPGHRSEERRVGKECRSRWSPYH